jgi:hypothetical protein
MRKIMRKAWGKVLVQFAALCVKSLTLRTGRSQRAVSYGYKASYLRTRKANLNHLFIHRLFSQFTPVKNIVLPIIPSPYKENNKLNKLT